MVQNTFYTHVIQRAWRLCVNALSIGRSFLYGVLHAFTRPIGQLVVDPHKDVCARDETENTHACIIDSR
jgi:hypothetical protein